MSGDTHDRSEDATTENSINGGRRRFLYWAGASAVGLPAAMGAVAAQDSEDEDESPVGMQTTTTVTSRTVTTQAVQSRSQSRVQPAPGQPSAQDQRTKPIQRPGKKKEYQKLKARAARGKLPQPSERFVQQAAPSQQLITLDKSYPGYRSTETPFVPPDPVLSVGDEKIIQMINTEWAIYDKDSGVREFSVTFPEWWSGEIDDPSTTFFSDTRTTYDPVGKRFLLLTFALDQTTGRSFWLLSVSDDESPFGAWYNYRIEPPDNKGLLDYPRLGLGHNAIYLLADLFEPFFIGYIFDGERFSIMDKTNVYGGGPVDVTSFTDLKNPDGTKAFVVRPPYDPYTTSPYYMVNSRFDMGETLTLWTVTNPLREPELSRQAVDVGSYSLPPPVEQRNTTATISTGDARLLNATIDETDGTLWTTHTIATTVGQDGETFAAARWYQLDPVAGTLLQSGVWCEPGTNYFYPAIKTNEDGDMMLVYNNAGPLIYPRLEVAGRTDGYTQNELEDKRIVKYGASFYDNFQPNSVPQRWGDYNGIARDPDNSHFWVTGQYTIYPNDQSVWQTQLAETYFSSSTVVPR